MALSHLVTLTPIPMDVNESQNLNLGCENLSIISYKPTVIGESE